MHWQLAILPNYYYRFIMYPFPVTRESAQGQRKNLGSVAIYFHNSPSVQILFDNSEYSQRLQLY